MEFSNEYLKSILHYNEHSGLFTWKVSLGKRSVISEVAGWLDKSTGYENIKINNKKHKSHRLAWFYFYNEIPYKIDHINHIKNDNRIVNLRNTNHNTNCKNKSMSKNNTSGHCGVYFHSKNNKWTSSIRVNGKQKHLGSFNSKLEAIQARENANIKYNFHVNHGKQATEL